MEYTQQLIANFLESPWWIKTIASLVIWQPCRSLINQWRINRIQRHYSKRVVCKSAKPHSTLLPIIVRIFGFSLSYLLQVPISFLEFIISLVTAVFENFKLLGSTDGKRTNGVNTDHSRTIENTKTSSPVVKRTTSERSVSTPGILRKRRTRHSSTPCHNRVVFSQHSNGAIKTQNHHYNPKATPAGKIVNTTKSATAEQNNSDLTRPILHAPAPTTQESRHHPNTDGKENYFQTTQKNNPEATVVARSLDRVEYSKFCRPYLNDSKQTLLKNRPNAASSLSGQMQKRRLEGQDLVLFPTPPVKRQNTGRISLESSTRPRGNYVMALFSRGINKKRREEREQLILKEMNRKRIKPAPIYASATIVASNLSSGAHTFPRGGSKETPKPAFSIRLTPAVTPTVTTGQDTGFGFATAPTAHTGTDDAKAPVPPHAQSASAVPTSKAEFSFGEKAAAPVPTAPGATTPAKASAFDTPPVATLNTVPSISQASKSSTYFGANSATNSSFAPTFGGAPSATATVPALSTIVPPKPAFSFGDNSANSASAVQEGGATSTFTPANAPAKPTSSFGGNPKAVAAHTNPTFGTVPNANISTPAAASTSQPTFSFGGNFNSAAPKFGTAAANPDSRGSGLAITLGAGAPSVTGASARRRSKTRGRRR